MFSSILELFGYRQRFISHSQVGQDEWVVEVLRKKRHGFFLEIGASDGVELSNTLALERYLGWKGICVEANPELYRKLRKNRKCNVVNALVSLKSGRNMPFQMDGMFSGVLNTKGGMIRNKGETITIKSTTLDELLRKCDAPKIIDYFGLDVEGHEHEIIEGLSSDNYMFRFITVEHNKPHQGSELRDNLRTTLEKKVIDL